MNKDNYPENMPEQFKPIRPWGYVGYFWLFSIPIVGLICMIVFATDDSKINRRNLARGYLWNLLIATILMIVVSIIMISAGVAIYNAARSSVGSSTSNIDSILEELKKTEESLNSYKIDYDEGNLDYNI